MEFLNIDEVTNKALRQAQKLLIGVSPISPYTFDYIKKELDILYKAIKNKGVMTSQDVDAVLSTVRKIQTGKDDVKHTLVIIEDLLKNALEIKYNNVSNKIIKDLYDAYYDLDNLALKETLNNVFQLKEDIDKFTTFAVGVYEKILDENYDSDINLIKDKYFDELKKHIDSLQNIDLNEKKRLIELAEDNRIKKELKDIFFEDINKYEDLVAKYVNFTKAEDEYRVLNNVLKSKIFALKDNEDLYASLKKDKLNNFDEVTNFNDFYKKVILVSLGKTEDINKTNLYEDLFNVVENNEIIDKVKKLEDKVKAIDSINNFEKTFIDSNGRKIDSLKFLKENFFNGKNITNVGIESSAKYKINIDVEDLKELHPDEIETIKRNAFDNYFLNTTVGLFGINKNNKINKKYVNSDGSLNLDIFLQKRFSSVERKFLRCLGSAKNPKQSFESTASLTSNCIKEYINELDRAFNEIRQSLSDNSASKIILGISGISLLIHYDLIIKMLKKESAINNLVQIEKNFYEIKEMGSKLTNKKDLQNLNLYIDLISNPNKINKIFLGKKRADLNAVFSLALKDISNFYLNSYPIKKFLDIKKNEIAEIKDCTINEIDKEFKNEQKEILKNKLHSIVSIVENYKKALLLLESKKELDDVINELKKEKEFILKEISQKDLNENEIEKYKDRLIEITNKMKETKYKLFKIKEDFLNYDYKIIGLDETKSMVDESIHNINSEIEFVKKIKENIEKGNIDINNIKKVLEISRTNEKRDIELTKQLNNLKTNLETKIEKINNFLEEGKIALDDESLETVTKLIMEISKDTLNKVKAVDLVKNNEGKEYLLKIAESSIKIDVLLEQEKKIKQLILKYLKEYRAVDDIKEKNEKKIKAQYYSALYDKTLELLDKQYDINKKLYNEIIDKVEKADDKLLYLKAKDGSTYTLPRNEIENFEYLIKLLKNGNYYEIIDSPNIDDLKEVLNFARNKYGDFNYFRKSLPLSGKYKNYVELKEKTNEYGSEIILEDAYMKNTNINNFIDKINPFKRK